MRLGYTEGYFAPGEAKGRLYGIPGGLPGIKRTLKSMSKFARQGARNPKVRALSLGIVRGAGRRFACPIKDYTCEARVLLRWVQQNIRWTRDVVGAETVQTPERTLEWRAGDCDDLSTLLAAMAMSIGMPARFKIVAADPNRPGDFSHVYALLHVHGKWVPAEPSVPDMKLGWETPRATMERVYDLDQDRLL